MPEIALPGASISREVETRQRRLNSGKDICQGMESYFFLEQAAMKDASAARVHQFFGKAGMDQEESSCVPRRYWELERSLLHN